MRPALVIAATCCLLVAAGDAAEDSSAASQPANGTLGPTKRPQPADWAFPGVPSQLASAFCRGQPSLKVELAAMLVHVKRNASFNYKLYLFAGDHVFQTGQVVPRDHFRVHAFPVRSKRLREFWPADVATTTYLVANSSSGQQQVPSDLFDLARFMAPVVDRKRAGNNQLSHREQLQRDQLTMHASLAGDAEFVSHDAARVELEAGEGANKNIQFDRDDQLSVSLSGAHLSSRDQRLVAASGGPQTTTTPAPTPLEHEPEPVVPVGSFSSFHVNTTYLVRKEFDVLEPQLVRIHIDANKFQVTQVQLISYNNITATGAPQGAPDAAFSQLQADYEFLGHKLLRNRDTQIVAISQIYEDWITRNFYTLVYVQRRLGSEHQPNGDIVNERLVFRGSSSSLAAIDELEYRVKAAAFITERAGLHYYVEFVDNNRFYLCAVDWSQRPFKVIDSRRFPMRTTRTLFDNQELLLCPPAVCYADRPVDELVDYGRLPEAPAAGQQGPVRLDTRLHLRDWVWPLTATDGEPAAGRHGWHYNRAMRNDIKPLPDTYGYVLTGHEIEASYRVHNELYLVSANHLITINYTLANETVVSKLPLADEFQQLASSLVDPITGAFYDRTSNHLYFFKGERYVGFDYATKKPLSDFVLHLAPPEPSSAELPGGPVQLALASQPVMAMLGRQHQVDAVYHDLALDRVYIFTGMKFYTFEGHQFQNGAFRVAADGVLPRLHCTNQRFLEGCHFDATSRNPCQELDEVEYDERVHHQYDHAGNLSYGDHHGAVTEDNRLASDGLQHGPEQSSFAQQQQNKLRRLVAPKSSLLELIVDNSLLNKGSHYVDSVIATHTGQPALLSEERLVIYLTMVMIALTIVILVFALSTLCWGYSATTGCQLGSTKGLEGSWGSVRVHGRSTEPACLQTVMSSQQLAPPPLHYARSEHLSKSSHCTADRCVHLQHHHCATNAGELIAMASPFPQGNPLDCVPSKHANLHSSAL